MRLPDGESSRVVLIGTSSHLPVAELPDLPSVHNNLLDLKEALGDPIHGWVTPDTCSVIDNPRTPKELASRLQDLAQEAEDLLLVYFAGHGLLDEHGSLHLALKDTEADGLLSFHAMPYSGVRQLVLNSRARNRVVILDCCFSGRALGLMAPADQVVTGQIGIRGTYILTATAANTAALAPADDRNTAFTGELLRLLREGDPEAQGQLLTLNDVHRFLLRSLIGRGLPRPSVQTGDTAGDLAIARNLGYRPLGRSGQTSSRLLLDEEERVGRGGDPLGAARRYANIAGVLLRLYGAEFADMQAAEASRAYWAKYAATAAPPRTTASGRLLGIDLGTTRAVISTLLGGEPEVVINSEGSETTPSVVAWSDDGTILVGARAARQAITNLERTVRFPARQLSDDWSIRIGGHSYTPAEVTAHILRKLKREAEAYLGEVVRAAVITVPALLDEGGRRTVEAAAEMAGLSVICLLAAPVAAALAYGLDKDEQTILVFDLGGGTFDVAVLEIGDGVVEVRAVNGDHLGGDDWDQRIVDHLVKQFQFRHGVDLAKDKMLLQRLREAAEKAKTELSSATETSINLPYITQSAKGPLHLDEKLTRAEFQQMTADLVERCKTPFHNVIEDAGLRIDEIDHILLIGGSTRMPAVAELIEELTGGKVPRRMPRSEQTPAFGAALRAGINKGEVKDALLLDVTPLSVGIETKDGIMTKIIERNTTIPTIRSEILTTIEDNQPSVQIPVYQGEREIATYNKRLGMLELTDLPPAPRGVPQIEVILDIDAGGRIHATAKDLGTGRAHQATLDGSDTAWRTHETRLLTYRPTPAPDAVNAGQEK